MEFNPEWIIYEDNHLLLLNKPAGLLTQADHTGELDLLSLSKAYIKKRYNKPGAVYLGMVHRLDRNTGGIICFAKTSKAAARLSEQIRKHLWQKSYLAICEGTAAQEAPEPEFIQWQDFILKDETRNVVSASDKGVLVKLRQRVLEVNSLNQNVLCLREIILETGKSHQIRVQCALRGQPLLGDKKYGSKSRILGVPEHFLGLWAYHLTLIHPISKAILHFHSLPPLESNSPWGLFAAPIEQACFEFETKEQGVF